MKSPDLVAQCCRAMADAVDIEVTVKCRIGVDEQDPETVLPDFLARVSDAGVSRFIIHARKAWLQGLSPKENRDIPPLDYDLVHRMKEQFPHLHISINGGIDDLEQAKAHLARGLDGVMIGRAAYHFPSQILCAADPEIYGSGQVADPIQVVQDLMPYIIRHVDQGGRLHQITRHILGAFHGRPGARAWRRTLSERAHCSGPDLVLEALEHIKEA
jgi:tRNA-dihydrouridine synthase A